MHRVPRIIWLILVVLVGIAIDLYLIAMEIYWAPILVFIAMMVAGMLIFTKLPPSPSEKTEARRLAPSGIARICRWLGFLYLSGLIGWVLIGGWRGVPAWGVVLLVLWSVCLIFGSFWIARKAARIPLEEWQQRMKDSE